MNDGNLGVAIGDVCGKGVPSALLTSSLHSISRFALCEEIPIENTGANHRKAVCEICPDNCYATLFVGEYDPLSGQLRYVNAGHEPPFVLRKQGKLFQTVFLEANGPMIGMLRPTTYREGMVSLKPGDVLVAYTDGLCDITSRVGEEWGWQRFLKAVEDCSAQRARDIMEGVMRTAEAFAGGAPQHDDVTLFVGRVQNYTAVSLTGKRNGWRRSWRRHRKQRLSSGSRGTRADRGVRPTRGAGKRKELSFPAPFQNIERQALISEITLMTPKRDRKSDSEMQERFFPTVRPVIPGLDYFGDWRPAQGVSGDYIDYFEMNDGNLGLAIGDVCGKGVPAALLTSSLHSMIRALRFERTFSLKALVQNIDNLFSEICPDNCYATLFVGEYDPASARLHYVNAGHEPPFVLHRQGSHFRTSFLEASGPVIGMLRESSYREGVVSLSPGDLLVAYTDGLCETTNRAGEEWGWQRLLKTPGRMLGSSRLTTSWRA